MLSRLCLAFGLAAFAFAANAGGPSLPKPVGQDLTVEVVQAQQEIEVDVAATGAAAGAQFGLIGALIGAAVDNAAAKKAEAAIAPVRNTLLGYDFNTRFEQEVRAKLASEGISTNPQFVFLTPLAMAERDEKHGERALQALVLRPRYAMDNGFNTMTVSIGLSYVEREKKSNGKYKERFVFSRNYTFNFPLDETGPQNVKTWTDLGSPTMKALLDQGIVQTVGMVVYDLSDQGRAEWEMSNKKMFAPLKGRRYPGMQLKSEPDYVWVRNGKKYMQVVQGFQIVSGPIEVPAAAEAPAVAEAPAAVDTQTVAAPAPAAEAPVAAPAAAGGSQ